MLRRLAKNAHHLPFDADAPKQSLHGKLRMSVGGGGADVACNQLPRFLIEISIEAGQHHGALRKFRDGRKQHGG